MHYQCLIVDDEVELAQMTCEYFQMFDISCAYVESVQAYEEFIAGERKIAGWHIDKLAIPTGEPDSRYRTIYAITDSVRDGIPNLHVRTSRVFLIFPIKKESFMQH